MGPKIFIWTMIGCLTVLAIPAAGSPGGALESRTVHFALTGTLVAGLDFEGEFGGFIGPGARVDLDLGQHYIVSPETVVVLSWDTVAPACTVNLRFGQGFFGLGPMITLTGDERWKNDFFLKVHVGVRAGMSLFEAVYITGRSSAFGGSRVALFGFTVGIVF